MSEQIYLGALTGMLFSSGVLVVSTYLRSRKYSLEDRVAPYVVDAEDSDRFLGFERVNSPIGVWGKALEPLVAKFEKILSVLSSPADELQNRLTRAGNKRSVAEHRLAQIQWAVFGLLMAIVLAIFLSVYRSFEVVPTLALLCITPLASLALCDTLLARQCSQRAARILSEFPTIAEILALSVASGEAPLAALERVSRTGSGALSEEITLTVADVRAGSSITKGLENLGKRTQILAIVRFADGVSVAVERGTPLAQVLRDQARDARDLGHRELMEVGGKKELHMLVPVIFLILPITVAFAVFPSLSVMDISF